MTALPIVERELRTAARRPAAWRSRVLVVLGAFVVWGFLLVTLRVGTVTRAFYGPALFDGLAGLLFVHALLSGALLLADSVSEEKREGTLGFLFLTDLRGSDVILGKLVAGALGSIYGLLAALPFLALPILLGGVSAGDVLRIAVTLVNTTFLSLAVGITVSTASRVERKAMSAAVLVVAAITLVPYVVLFWVTEDLGFDDSTLLIRLQQPSPLFLVLFSTRAPTGMPVGSADFVGALAFQHLLAWALILRACALVPHVWRDRISGRVVRSWREWRDQIVFGDSVHRRERRRALLGVNPFVWLLLRDRLKRINVWVFVGSMIVIWIYSRLANGVIVYEAGPGGFLILVANSLLKVWITAEVCVRLADDRRSGALELILCTPVTVSELVKGHWLSLQRQFLRPLLLFFALEALLLFNLNARVPESLHRWQNLAALFEFVLDLFALGWVGMWQAMISKTANRAMIVTIGKVLVAPWLVVMALTSLMNVWLQLQGTNLDASTSVTFTWLATAIFTGASVCWGWLWARPRVLGRLREVAAGSHRSAGG